MLKKSLRVWFNDSTDLEFLYFSKLREKVIFRKLLGNLFFHGINIKQYLLLFNLLSSQKYLNSAELTRAVGLLSFCDSPRSGNLNWSQLIKPVRRSTIKDSEGKKIELGELVKMINFDGFLITNKLTDNDLSIEFRRVKILKGRTSNRPRTPSAVGTKSKMKSSKPSIGNTNKGVPFEDLSIIDEINKFLKWVRGEEDLSVTEAMVNSKTPSDDCSASMKLKMESFLRNSPDQFLEFAKIVLGEEK
jgi:hypothetical protein